MMQPYLVVRLYGPMASRGQPAVGGDRHTGIHPSRSALLGLLGAALGIKRDDQARLHALQKSVLFAVKQSVPSSLLRDYHTVQMPSKGKHQFNTRKQELNEKKLNTVLSSRDYRCDGLWIVAVSLTAEAEFTLSAILQALQSPVYSLCLGRKSCPPALPLMPKIIENVELKSALDTEFPPVTGSLKSDQYWFGSNGFETYYWQGEKTDLGDHHATVITTQPWDEPINRKRWQFKQRVMHQVSLPITTAE